MVDFAWPEISDQLARIESFMDDDAFPEKQLAAYIASKVFYNLSEHDEALRLAFEAGDRFDIMADTLYTETLVHKCIDLYTAKRYQMMEKKEQVFIDPKMEAVVNRKFDQCFIEGKFKQAIGIALETRRADMV